MKRAALPVPAEGICSARNPYSSGVSNLLPASSTSSSSCLIVNSFRCQLGSSNQCPKTILTFLNQKLTPFRFCSQERERERKRGRERRIKIYLYRLNDSTSNKKKKKKGVNKIINTPNYRTRKDKSEKDSSDGDGREAKKKMTPACCASVRERVAILSSFFIFFFQIF